MEIAHDLREYTLFQEGMKRNLEGDKGSSPRKGTPSYKGFDSLVHMYSRRKFMDMEILKFILKFFWRNLGI